MHLPALVRTCVLVHGGQGVGECLQGAEKAAQRGCGVLGTVVGGLHGLENFVVSEYASLSVIQRGSLCSGRVDGVTNLSFIPLVTVFTLFYTLLFEVVRDVKMTLSADMVLPCFFVRVFMHTQTRMRVLERGCRCLKISRYADNTTVCVCVCVHGRACAVALVALCSQAQNIPTLVTFTSSLLVIIGLFCTYVLLLRTVCAVTSPVAHGPFVEPDGPWDIRQASIECRHKTCAGRPRACTTCKCFPHQPPCVPRLLSPAAGRSNTNNWVAAMS